MLIDYLAAHIELSAAHVEFSDKLKECSSARVEFSAAHIKFSDELVEFEEAYRQLDHTDSLITYTS